MKLIRLWAALMALAFSISAPAVAQLAAPIYRSGSASLTATGTFPVASAPVAYTGAPIDMRSYATVTIACSTAPTAGTIQGSADGTNYFTQSAVLNNSAGFTTTTQLTAVGVFNISGHQYVQVSGMTGGACLISGGQ